MPKVAYVLREPKGTRRPQLFRVSNVNSQCGHGFMYFKYEAEGRRLAGEREPERQRERGERERACVCVRERERLNQESMSGWLRPGRRFNADHVPTDTSPGCQHNTNMDNGMITTNMPT